jgi:5-formyltetrahydrofolate cyclo-ligase
MERTFLTKSELRRAIRANIRSLSADERAEAARLIVAEIESDPRFVAARTVAAFMPLGDEPPLREAVERWAQSKRMVVPKIEGDEMHFCDFRADEMASGAFGIAEPQTTATCPPEQIEVMIVPAVGLTRQGARMGRGRGYYDRYLGQHNAASIYKISTCFACQLVEELPTEPHDVVMDRVVAH